LLGIWLIGEKNMITPEKKRELIAEFKINDDDTGSAHIQIALLTERIKNLTEHLKANKKDHSSRRGLLKLVGQRARLLKYLNKNDHEMYNTLTTKLNIRRK